MQLRIETIIGIPIFPVVEHFERRSGEWLYNGERNVIADLRLSVVQPLEVQVVEIKQGLETGISSFLIERPWSN